jgi:hypothetical protein
MPTFTSIIKRGLSALLDRLPSRRQARPREEYDIPPFLLAPDPQLPPRPPAEVGKEPPTPIGRIVTPDLEVIIFSDGHQLKIQRSRKGR